MLIASTLIGAAAVAAVPGEAIAGGMAGCAAAGSQPATVAAAPSAAEMAALTPGSHADRALLARKLTVTPRTSAGCAGKTGKTGTASPMAAVTGSGFGYVSPFYQYGQQRNYWCGPATVEEMSATVPGSSPVGLSQSTLASYMGTSSNGGTDLQPMINGLNHYVGQPDFGFNYYVSVDMDYSPTASQRSVFLADLQYDVDQKSTPVVGRAEEVAGGPHLVGHPVNENIDHYFAIGGWSTNTNEVYYADSATTVWSGVPAYSWLDTNKVETILGGHGYIW